jgi:RNA polymerase sigma-70 factor (ECF subfamily)
MVGGEIQSEAGVEASAEESASGASVRAWIETHGDALWRYVLHHVGDPHACEDILQEALLSAWASREDFRGESSERTWLTGILRHKILDHWRRERRRAGMVLDEDPFGSDDRWKARPAAWDAPDEEITAALRVCLESLPVPLARAFELVEVRGCPTGQSAAMLGISARNLWVRLHRARTMLRACITKRTQGGGGS